MEDQIKKPICPIHANARDSEEASQGFQRQQEP